MTHLTCKDFISSVDYLPNLKYLSIRKGNNNKRHQQLMEKFSEIYAPVCTLTNLESLLLHNIIVDKDSINHLAKLTNLQHLKCHFGTFNKTQPFSLLSHIQKLEIEEASKDNLLGIIERCTKLVELHAPLTLHYAKKWLKDIHALNNLSDPLRNQKKVLYPIFTQENTKDTE